MERSRRSALGVGILLIVLGLFLLARQIFPEFLGWHGPLIWPMSVIGFGVFLLLLGLVTGNPGLAVPGCIVGGIGALLYWQNLTDRWDSWAYVWTLIPGFAGVGSVIEGLLTGRLQKVTGGGWTILISLVLFAIFSSLLGGPQLLGVFWPVLLILLGLIALARYFIWSQRG